MGRPAATHRGAVVLCVLAAALLALACPSSADAADYEAEFARLDSVAQAGPASLADWARLESTRQQLTAALAADLAADPAGGTAGLDRRLRDRLLEGWLRGEPALLELLTDGWSPAAAGAWNDDGALTVPAGAILLSRGEPTSAAAWLQTGSLPDEDRVYGAVLRVQAELASGDTLAAGATARAALGEGGSWPDWARRELEQAGIEAHLAAGDTAEARLALAGYSGQESERGRWLLYRSRLARLTGRVDEAEELLWRVVSEYPGGRTAERVLRALVPAEGTAPADLGEARLRRLLKSAEERGDLARFRSLERTLRSRVGPAGQDSLSIRGARLAFAAKEYELIAEQDRSGAWSAGGPLLTEWRLLTARALRNTGRAEEMAARYALVERTGATSDRATACYEWAREMEALRRFREADSLYARMLGLGAGDLRAQVMLRRGICRFGAQDWPGARARLEEAAAVGSAEDRACAWFWIYRAELAAGHPDLARTALAKAAEGKAGYYGQRAASALALAAAPGGASVTDVEGYWRAVGTLGAEVRLEQARASIPVGRSLPSSVRWARDRLLLFRLCARADWAGRMKETLEDRARAANLLSSSAWRAWGFPDLAAREAVRGGGRLPERFPTDYPGEVGAAAERFGVAPEWLWAVMRRESFFESSVVSRAGATGLLQLMDATARATAEGHGLPAGPLQSPRVNVQLGAAHLHDLLVDEPGDWPVVLAAYNASLANARRWRRPGEDPDFYIEMIGYRETREYVRRVLEGFWTYRQLLRGE